MLASRSVPGIADEHFNLAIVGGEYTGITRDDVASANRRGHYRAGALHRVAVPAAETTGAKRRVGGPVQPL